ncbi:nuclear transport factor 2 family protein [Chondromyces crocatus]|uniref:DUF4440 domain-containing protein n=1 Tax=Chondromyces crocatus TaxID=52 RepID=A0A0K1EFM0_CHOCO|nr:nuclear transport factor 2 family protein [Chondromyces crocatus]AKT39492.1 uncharacterized protein CMC5_036390 [Chondromyces crocatus]
MTKISSEQARDEIALRFQEWSRAVGEAKDYEFLSELLSDDWVYTDFTGTSRGKRDYIAFVDGMASYEQSMQRLDARLVRDDLVIASGVYRARAALKSGLEADNTIAFSSVWERDGHVWRCLLTHTTRVIPPP